ncbi:hypothetical protein IL306_005149 [Fusarium sp. DS 682]|nr:hypothetical protein IL306_005149 [Fusarium sp. DS 682]
MKISILGLLTLSAFASACARYESCHCYDSNGIPNNGATQAVCDHYKGGMEPNTREYGAALFFTFVPKDLSPPRKTANSRSISLKMPVYEIHSIDIDVLQEFSNPSSIYFVKVDVDSCPELARDHGIRAMPTFVIYKDGQNVDYVVQGASKEKVEAYILKYKP